MSISSIGSLSAPTCPQIDAARHGPPTYMLGGIIAGKSPVSVKLHAVRPTASNQLWYSTDGWKTKQRLGTDADNRTVHLGRLRPGTRVEFGLTDASGTLVTAHSTLPDGRKLGRGIATGGNEVSYRFVGKGGSVDALLSVKVRKTW